MHLSIQKVLEFKQCPSVAMVPPVSQPDIIAAAYATFKVAELAIPSAPVEDLQKHYMDVVEHGVLTAISMFNECVPINTDMCKYLIHKLWCIKYSNIHWHNVNAVDDTVCYFEAISNVKLYLDANSIEFLNKNTKAIILISNELKDLDEELENEKINGTN